MRMEWIRTEKPLCVGAILRYEGKAWLIREIADISLPSVAAVGQRAVGRCSTNTGEDREFIRFDLERITAREEFALHQWMIATMAAHRVVLATKAEVEY